MGMNREDFISKLEKEGTETVRRRLADPANYTDSYRAMAIEWLGAQDTQRLVASDAFQASQAETASRAADAAARAADAAERANKHATTANAIAIIAIVVAAISLLISIFRPFAEGS
jgi:hypothetical protein